MLISGCSQTPTASEEPQDTDHVPELNGANHPRSKAQIYEDFHAFWGREQLVAALDAQIHRIDEQTVVFGGYLGEGI